MDWKFNDQNPGTKALRFSIVFFALVSCAIMTHAVAQAKRSSLAQAKVPAKDVTKNVSVNTIVQEQEYHYASMSEPNPFVPPLLSTLMARLVLPIESVLQKYPLATLKVVGIWTLRNLDTRAMIMTPNGEGVVVKPGSPLGRRGGQITLIDTVSVSVREFSLASDGTRLYEDSKLWIEEGEPKFSETSLVINSQKVGLPNRFGYGKKNYMNSPTYEERHKELLRKIEEERTQPVIDPDDNRPSFPSPETPASSRPVPFGLAPYPAGVPPYPAGVPPYSAGVPPYSAGVPPYPTGVIPGSASNSIQTNPSYTPPPSKPAASSPSIPSLPQMPTLPEAYKK